MRLGELNPSFTAAAQGLTEILMDCPVHRDRRLRILARLNGAPSPGIFAWTANFNRPGWDTVTITPSVKFDKGQAHGRRWPPCSVHFQVTEGEVTLCAG